MLPPEIYSSLYVSVTKLSSSDRYAHKIIQKLRDSKGT
jgi:hypothetical protein